MSNELALQLGVGELILKQLSPQQQGWLRLASIKKESFDELTRLELQVQGNLSGIDTCEVLADVQEKLKLARASVLELKECRLRFTRMLDEKLVLPSMEYEKRSEALLTPAIKRELDLRIAASEKANKKAAHDREVALFKAHVINEFYRISAEYRAMLKNEINTAYLGALQTSMPIENVPTYVEEIKAALKSIELPKFIKFSRKLILDPEALVIFKSVPPYDGQQMDLGSANEELDEKFSMYANDLANASAAIESQTEQHEQYQQEVNDALSVEMATNNLVAAAQPLVLTGSIKIKRTMVAVTDDSEGNAIAILAGFIKNWQLVMTFVKVKSLQKLSIGQMAEAIGKMVTENPDIKINNLNFVEKVK